MKFEKFENFEKVQILLKHTVNIQMYSDFHHTHNFIQILFEN